MNHSDVQRLDLEIARAVAAEADASRLRGVVATLLTACRRGKEYVEGYDIRPGDKVTTTETLTRAIAVGEAALPTPLYDDAA